MYTTSAAFKAAMAQPSRELTARGTITFPDATTHALTPTEISKFTITENAGDHLPLGGVSASTLTLVLDNRQGEWEPGGSILGNKTLDGAEVSLMMGIKNPSYQPAEIVISGGDPDETFTDEIDGGSTDETFENTISGIEVEIYWRNVGVFVIENPVSQEQDAIITLKGSDYLANRALTAFSDTLTYPQTVLQIATEACLQANITLKTTVFINSAVSIPVKPVWDEKTTCRDVISYVACLAGGFARIDRNGDLEFIGTFDGANYYVHPNRYKKLTNQGVMFGPFNALSVYEYGAPNGYGATRIADDVDIIDNELNSVSVRGNPMLAYGGAALTTLMMNMLASLGGLEYYAASIEWQGDPSITCGDVVTISNLKSEAYNVLITNQTLTFDSGFSMVSGNRLNTAVVGKAKVENLRVFTPTGKLNAAALEGDINIRAGRQLNLLSDGALVVKSGAGMSINAGGNFDLNAGTGKSGIGMSNNRSDDAFIWAGSDSPATAPFSVTMDGELKASSVSGFVIPPSMGGSGYSKQIIYRGNDYPNSSIGEDGDMFVFFNGAADTSWSAQTLTYGAAGQNTYFGVSRNWNQVPTAGFYRFGNGVGSSAYDFGAYAYFTAPAATNSLTFTFVTAKYYNSTWYGYSGTTTYKVALVKASNMSVILASTTCYASQSQNTQTVTLTTAANMVQGNTYYIAVYFDGSDEKTNAGIVGNITMQAKVSNSQTYDFLIKSNGQWYAMFGHG